MLNSPPTVAFDTVLSDETDDSNWISMELAQKVFNFFKDAPLSRWTDGNNDCEDRANALCMLLDAWNIPNFKGWVFSGYFLKRNLGSLINYWNYHVAAVLPVHVNGTVQCYVIDPSTDSALQLLKDWALRITAVDTSYYLLKESDIYIFPPRKITRDNWYRKNKRNYNWTMQGLSGINGLSSIGKAHLSFNKQAVKRTAERFKKMMKDNPFSALNGRVLSNDALQ